MRPIILLLVLLGTCYCSTAQTRGIYLGEVNRNDSSTYLKIAKAAYGTYYTGLEKISYPIYIQLSVSGYPNWVNEEFELYLDTAFKMKYQRHMLDTGADGRFILVKEITNIPVQKVDSIFTVLVANGIFSLPAISTKQVMAEYKPLELTTEGAKTSPKTGVADGNQYVLRWKVDNFYSLLIFDNPHVYLDYHPDITIFKRQAAIVSALRSIAQ